MTDFQFKGKGIFITGTGTDIGKTYVTGLLVKYLHEAEVKVAYYKAAMSGNVRDEAGQLIPVDALQVKTMSGIEQSLESMCPYVYEHAVSPHLASQIEGNPVRMQVVQDGFERLCQEYDFVVVEGSGGIVCPISVEPERIQLEDIVKKLGLPSVIVADAGLGTINSVVMTAEYMKARSLPVAGLIMNNFHAGDVMEEDNVKMCQEMTGLPLLACVAPNAKSIEIKRCVV